MMNWKRKILTAQEESQIETRIKELEEKTGAEFMVAILKKSDPYPGAVVRFGLFFLIITYFIFINFYEVKSPEVTVIIMLTLAFLGSVIGRVSFFKKLAFSPTELDREVTEKSHHLFRVLKVDKTKSRVGSFLLISVQEKRLRFLADRGLRDKMKDEDLKNIIKHLEQKFQEKDYYRGMMDTIDQLEETILHFFPNKIENESDRNELPNRIYWGA